MPPSRTGATFFARPLLSSVSTAMPHKVAGAVGRLEARARHLAQETVERLVLLHADDRIEIAGHADVGDEGGAARQDAVIGGRRMGMRADHERGAAIGEIAHRLLLAGRLAMDVDDDGVGVLAERAGGQLALDRREGIVERIHEDAAHGVDDQRALAVLGVDQRGAAARRAGRIIERANQPRRALDEHQRLALIPGMIAERDGVGAGVDEFVVDRLGDAEAAGGVLAVDDDEIELPVGDQSRQPLADDGAPGAPDHVADEQNSHAFSDLAKSITSRSVSTRSSRSSRSVAGTRSNFLRGKGDADGDHLLHRAQGVDGHVVIAGAVADAVAGAVEGGERHDQDVGIDFAALRHRLADAPLPGLERVAEFPCAHDQRLAARRDHRQRELRAGVGKLAHQRQRIDLGLHRREAGDDRAGRDRTGKARAAIVSRRRPGAPAAAARRACASAAARSCGFGDSRCRRDQS